MFSLLEPTSLEAQAESVQVYYIQLWVCEHVITGYMDYSMKKARLVFKRLKLARMVEVWWKTWQLLWWVSLIIIIFSLTNAIKKKKLCKVGISEVLTIQSPVKKKKKNKLSPWVISWVFPFPTAVQQRTWAKQGAFKSFHLHMVAALSILTGMFKVNQHRWGNYYCANNGMQVQRMVH